MRVNRLILAFSSLIPLCATTLAQEQSSQVVERLIEHATSSSDGRHPWTFDKTVYQRDTRELPIGVFDSGIGGLTVLEAILACDAFDNDSLSPRPDGRPDFLGERFIYLGDQANMPYGNYPAAGKLDFLRELILKDVVFLLGKRSWASLDAARPNMNKPPVKAIAIGCNTATAYGLEDIKAALQAWDIPVFVVGVVEAGARGLLESHRAEETSGHSVAVLATVGTCNSQAYPKAIGKAMGLAGRRVPTIVQQGFADLAAAIEGDAQVLARHSVKDIIRKDIHQLITSYQQGGSAEPIGSIVLGCTHFPLVKDDILSALEEVRLNQVNGEKPFESLIAQHITVVDPAELTAKELFRSLAKARLRSAGSASQVAQDSADLYFISVPNPHCSSVRLASDGGLEYEYKYGRQTDQLEIEDTLVVPMLPEQLPASSLQLIRSSLPHVWKSLSGASSVK